MDKAFWSFTVLSLLWKFVNGVGTSGDTNATAGEEGSGLISSTAAYNETTTEVLPEAPNWGGIAIGITFGVVALIILLTCLYLRYCKEDRSQRIPTFDNPITFEQDSSL